MNINLIKNSILKYNNFFDTHFKEKKNLLWKLFYFLDLVIAFIIHGSTVTDYFEYEYYKKRYYERKSFVTFKRAKKYWEVLHKQEYIDELYDKLKIYKNFNKSLGREYIYIYNGNFI